MTADLRTDPNPDLSTVELSYEGFRHLAQNAHLSSHEKIGFPDHYRAGKEPAIFADICSKLPAIEQRSNQVVVDIGPGCAGLPHLLIDLCADRDHKLILVDSVEMLDQLPDASHVVKVVGSFPSNLDQIRAAAQRPADALLCYSVLHYMYVDTNLFDVVDAVATLLGPGGRALFGDIPNASKRRRFFASTTGRAFHREFMKTDEDPIVGLFETERGKIDDAVLAGLIARARGAGLHGYVVPQAPDLPFSNRRDDLLIEQP